MTDISATAFFSRASGDGDAPSSLQFSSAKGKDFDWHTARHYLAETTFTQNHQHRQYADLGEAQAHADRIAKSEGVSSPRILQRRGAPGSSYRRGGSYGDGDPEIALTPDHMHEAALIHEMTHHVRAQNGQAEGHDQNFSRDYGLMLWDHHSRPEGAHKEFRHYYQAAEDHMRANPEHYQNPPDGQRTASATDFFHQATTHPGPSVDSFAKQDGEDWHDHQDRVKRGLSLGHLSYTDARTHGYSGDSRQETRHDGWGPAPDKPKGWQPLPSTLYHTTTDAAGVAAHGLRTGSEIGQKNGHGLGGTPDWLSLTHSAEHAHTMLNALHEYHDHLNGKTSFADLHHAAQNGEGAQKPYHEGLESAFAGENDYARDSRMRGKRLEPGFTSYDEAKGKGWTPHPQVHQNLGEGKDGKTWGSGWERDANVEDRHDEYGAFSRAREWHGKGTPSILFASNDRKAFAAKDPSNFAVLKVRPKPGAHGFPMEGEHEWRTGTGDAVETHGEPLRRTSARVGQVVRPFSVTAVHPRPDLPPEQEEALGHPDFSEYRRRSLDLAKNPAPGTAIWRGEARHGEPEHSIHDTGVGMHWSVNPDSLLIPHGEEGQRKTVWQGRLEHPAEQAIPRSHPMWNGNNGYSMDHEAEVRLHPGTKVHVDGAYVWHGDKDDSGPLVPRHPDRSHPDWKWHPIGQHADVSNGGHIDYSHHGIDGDDKTPASDTKTPAPWAGSHPRAALEHEHAAGNHYTKHPGGDLDDVDWDAPEDHWRAHSNAIGTDSVLSAGITHPHELNDDDASEWLRWHPDRAGIEQRHGGQHTASSHVPLTFEHRTSRPSGHTHTVIGRHADGASHRIYGDGYVGHLSWRPAGSEIGNVEVHPDWRRRGVATALLGEARTVTPGLQHSDDLSDDGSAWAEHTASTGHDDPDCAYKHDGSCPTWDEQTAERTAALKQGDFTYEVRPNDDTGMTLHGYVAGEHAGHLDHTIHGDGAGVHVNELHTNPAHRREGVASAMMDALHQHYPDAWINHGTRTPAGTRWWHRYTDPAPHRNVHNVAANDTSHGMATHWTDHWNPTEVAGDIKDNKDLRIDLGLNRTPAVQRRARADDGSVRPFVAAGSMTCPDCKGEGEDTQGRECDPCDGQGYVTTPVPDNTKPYEHEHDWLPPREHFFAPTADDLDPRLFDGDRIRPEVRYALLGALNDFWAPKYGDSWQSWARVYLAGSEASHFYGNNDLDVLIGVDYDAARHHVDAFAGEPDRAIDTKLTDELREGLNSDHRMLPGPSGKETGPYESTFYVNPDSWDLKKLKPYAAYDLTNDQWEVRPVTTPDDFGPEKLPESTWDVMDAVTKLVKAVGELPEGTREREGAALWDYLHGDRHAAFGPDGTGLYDPANVVWKSLDKAPGHPLQQLIDWKHAHDGATATDQENAA